MKKSLKQIADELLAAQNALKRHEDALIFLLNKDPEFRAMMENYNSKQSKTTQNE